MTKSKLFLVRHGQTVFNLEDRLGGDSELTPEGIQHAEKVAAALLETSPALIYHSPLKRSRQTAEIIKKYHPNSPLTEVSALVEISCGNIDSLTYAEFEQKFPDLFAAREADRYRWAFPNGESYKTAEDRVKPFLDGLRLLQGNLVIVGHRGINRAILGLLLGLPKEQMPHLVIPNDVLFEIDLETPGEVYHVKDGQRIPGYVVGK